jgi:NAD(P)-dependent dehydrogenase (short-subunit alcohol dehydrogenase family)
MTTELAGAVVAVIGASGGLGAPIAERLAARGARLVLAGRDTGRLAALAVPGATVVALDLRDPSAGDVLVAAAESSFGRLDGVVNAAGIVAFGPLAETDDMVLEELFLTNVLGPLWLCKRVVPALTATRGFFVNVSAVVAEAPLPGMVPYSASKAALTAADRALARELRRSGIRVVDVRPPHTETGLADRPVAGVSPRLPAGLAPGRVADRVVAAIEAGESDVAADQF